MVALLDEAFGCATGADDDFDPARAMADMARSLRRRARLPPNDVLLPVTRAPAGPWSPSMATTRQRRVARPGQGVSLRRRKRD